MNQGCYSISSLGTRINKVVQFNVCQADDEAIVINKRKKQPTIAWNMVPKKKGNTSHWCLWEGRSTDKGKNRQRVTLGGLRSLQ